MRRSTILLLSSLPSDEALARKLATKCRERAPSGGTSAFERKFRPNASSHRIRLKRRQIEHVKRYPTMCSFIRFDLIERLKSIKTKMSFKWIGICICKWETYPWSVRQVRVWVVTPPPQVREHSLASDHSDHSPESTTFCSWRMASAGSAPTSALPESCSTPTKSVRMKLDRPPTGADRRADACCRLCRHLWPCPCNKFFNFFFKFRNFNSMPK